MLQPIVIPERYNYIAAFLTLGCNLRCSFCINRFGDAGARYGIVAGEKWIEGLNRIESRPDLPITLQGGEPSLHPDFHNIILGIKPELNVDILTNLQFDVDRFMEEIPPHRVKRDAPYASIRVSYHPETMRLEEIKPKILRLLEHGYSVGVWAVQHPRQVAEIERARDECVADGIDFRLKEFLGMHGVEVYGSYRYDGALSRKPQPPVECRTSELIIGPTGAIYRCHGDLYDGRPSIGDLCEPGLEVRDAFRPCNAFGFCNPCDVKIKTDRFQEFGHTSVDIRPVSTGSNGPG